MCEAGKHQPARNATECKQCVSGSYCEEGSSAPLPCEAGRFSSATHLHTMSQCQLCTDGAFCPTQSVTPSNCSAGSYTSNATAHDKCTRCAAGTFQNGEGATACDLCTPGYFCAEGAAAALPCPGGTTKRTGIVMKSKADCTRCGVGTYCPVGSGTATNCSAGTYNDQEKQEVCRKCVAGTFQDAESGTACSYCSRGHFCLEGASVALPCPGAARYPFQ